MEESEIESSTAMVECSRVMHVQSSTALLECSRAMADCSSSRYSQVDPW